MDESEVRAKFEEAKERLKSVHTRGELEEARGEVYKWRDKLLWVSEDFRREHEERQRASQARARFSELDGRVSEIRGRAEQIRRDADRLRPAPFTFDPRLRGAYDDRLEKLRSKALGNRLICPECNDVDRHNVQVTGKGKRKRKTPWCFKCNVPLVPADKAEKWKGDNIKLRRKFSDEEKRMGWGR